MLWKVFIYFPGRSSEELKLVVKCVSVHYSAADRKKLFLVNSKPSSRVIMLRGKHNC